ncbi:MAG: cytochrome c oxidase subunit 3 [Bacteroidota bacterium]
MMNSINVNDGLKIVERPAKILSMDPRRFILWLFIVTIVMLFASLTSAYIVRRAEGNWLSFELPFTFWVTSAILVLSSISIHWSLYSARKDNISNVKTGLIATLILGFGFLVGQVYAWGDLVRQDVFFVGNPSGSFLYVLTGIHGLHIISALVFLAIVIVLTFRYRVHSKKTLWVDLCATYWHFLDVLWLYLFGFLIINH